MSTNPRLGSAFDAYSNLDVTGSLGAFRDTADAAAQLSDRGRQAAIEKLKAFITGGGYNVPTPGQLGISQGIYPDGTMRYDQGEVLNGYRDAARLIGLHQQGVIDLDFNTYQIKTIGTAKLTPAQFSAEIESRYSRAFAAGVESADERYKAGGLRYPVDMPEQLQKGLYADNYAKEIIIKYTNSIGVPEGPGQLISLNRWSYDPAGTGLYTRPDVLMNFGRGSIAVLDGKAMLYKDVVNSSAIRMQFETYYRYGASSVKAITPTGSYYIPRSSTGRYR
jgi:hypothetical protein